MRYAKIPRRWPGGTVACIATGPSLTAEDVEYVRGKVDGVIAVNNAIDLAPWADILYACDGKWWGWRKGMPSFQGTKYAMKDDARRWHEHDVQMIRKGPKHGVDPRPDTLAHGCNSGYQAIGLAAKLGAARIVLLGYDMRVGPQGQHHFHGKHPDGTKPPFKMCLDAFGTLVKPLSDLGVEVVNCSPNTALKCFSRAPLAVAVPVRGEWAREVAS